MSKPRILPLAAAVTAVTAVSLGASPALASPLSQGKRDEVKAVAFPLLAVKGQEPASIGAHVSHSSHVSGSGIGHVSHASHVSSVPGPVPTTAVPAAPPPAAPPPAATVPPAATTPSPTPTASLTTSGPPVVAPTQGSTSSSPAVVATVSPSTSKGHGCAFVLVAPFGALAGRIKRYPRRRSSR
ncbi:MAG: hypothetical protein ACRDOI_46350 [Trebonia sp.]